jgi:hypothetical protein
MLVDSNPREIAQAIVCEHVRLERLYGAWKAESIADEVMDTLLTARDDSARRRVDAVLANSMFDSACGRSRGAAPKPATGDSSRS